MLMHFSLSLVKFEKFDFNIEIKRYTIWNGVLDFHGFPIWSIAKILNIEIPPLFQVIKRSSFF